jgi:hypothetical protein
LKRVKTTHVDSRKDVGEEGERPKKAEESSREHFSFRLYKEKVLMLRKGKECGMPEKQVKFKEGLLGR